MNCATPCKRTKSKSGGKQKERNKDKGHRRIKPHDPLQVAELNIRLCYTPPVHRGNSHSIGLPLADTYRVDLGEAVFRQQNQNNYTQLSGRKCHISFTIHTKLAHAIVLLTLGTDISRVDSRVLHFFTSFHVLHITWSQQVKKQRNSILLLKSQI